jgi:hypothetical protein
MYGPQGPQGFADWLFLLAAINGALFVGWLYHHIHFTWGG